MAMDNTPAIATVTFMNLRHSKRPVLIGEATDRGVLSFNHDEDDVCVSCRVPAHELNVGRAAPEIVGRRHNAGSAILINDGPPAKRIHKRTATGVRRQREVSFHIAVQECVNGIPLDLNKFSYFFWGDCVLGHDEKLSAKEMAMVSVPAW